MFSLAFYTPLPFYLHSYKESPLNPLHRVIGHFLDSLLYSSCIHHLCLISNYKNESRPHTNLSYLFYESSLPKTDIVISLSKLQPLKNNPDSPFKILWNTSLHSSEYCEIVTSQQQHKKNNFLIPFTLPPIPFKISTVVYSRIICTCPPCENLLQFLQLWATHIAPKFPKLSLELYSFQLSKALKSLESLKNPLIQLMVNVIEHNPSVKVFDPLPFEIMQNLFVQSYAYIHLTHSYETSGQSFLEATYAGLPIIALKTSLSQEYLLEGITGYIAPDWESLYALLENLLENPQEQKRLSRLAQDHAKSFLSMNHVAKNFITYIHSLKQDTNL